LIHTKISWKRIKVNVHVGPTVLGSVPQVVSRPRVCGRGTARRGGTGDWVHQDGGAKAVADGCHGGSPRPRESRVVTEMGKWRRGENIFASSKGARG
jgi:hypothetical protein